MFYEKATNGEGLKSTRKHWNVINCKIHTSLVSWWLTFYVFFCWTERKKSWKDGKSVMGTKLNTKVIKLMIYKKRWCRQKWGINFWIIYEPVRSHIHDPFQSHFSRSWRDLGVHFFTLRWGLFLRSELSFLDSRWSVLTWKWLQIPGSVGYDLKEKFEAKSWNYFCNEVSTFFIIKASTLRSSQKSRNFPIQLCSVWETWYRKMGTLRDSIA